MKNVKMTIVAVLVALVAVTTYSVSGTYAKYTDTFEGTSDSARVAKWAIELTDANDTTNTPLAKTFTFDLFKALKEADGTTAETDVNSTDIVIAPGTGGKVDLKLSNKSEVNAKYKVEYTVTNAGGIPVEFLVNGNWVTSLPDTTTATYTNINSGADDTVSIQWRWAFEGKDSENYQTTQTDTTDTDLGTAASATIQVEAKVIVEQVD
ncbi:MAG: hypothetical protein K2G03_02130 [Bacilli bacterium]|nr:hypothetical protein [Bacilli bacterium]MDE6141378.1 hypothetical protein [Bacilli bacterium]